MFKAIFKVAISFIFKVVHKAIFTLLLKVMVKVKSERKIYRTFRGQQYDFPL